jgi:iron transport multicopper oxidase
MAAHILAFIILSSLPNYSLSTVIGPIANIHINNANISPDGFTRSGVLAEGAFPGPVVVGNKVNELSINIKENYAN